MVRQWLSVAGGMLDELIACYPVADAAQKAAIEAQLRAIQEMSDAIVEGWLQVEEKLARLRGMVASGGAGGDGLSAAAVAPPIGGQDDQADTSAVQAHAQAAIVASDSGAQEAQAGTAQEADRLLTAGRGYYELAMYREAAASFRRAVELRPESLAARMFLAMSHMHLKEWEDAERHFLFIVRTASQPKLKALGLNALGCIQAVTANLEQAAHYFRQACEADPAFTGAARNLANCTSNAGPLTLYFGDAGFGCT